MTFWGMLVACLCNREREGVGFACIQMYIWSFVDTARAFRVTKSVYTSSRGVSWLWLLCMSPAHDSACITSTAILGALWAHMMQHSCVVPISPWPQAHLLLGVIQSHSFLQSACSLSSFFFFSQGLGLASNAHLAPAVCQQWLVQFSRSMQRGMLCIWIFSLK